MFPPLLIELNVIVILFLLGGYQLYLQFTIHGRKRFEEGFVKRLQYIIGIPAIGNLLIFLFDPDIVGWVYIPVAFHVTVIGILIFNAAALFIFWTHLVLGNYWSGELETREDHVLIDRGPYRWIRHPLYSGYLVLTLGLFFMTHNWFVGVTTIAYFIAVAARAWKEEAMLCAVLGTAYEEYMKDTGRFLPQMRLGREKRKSAEL